MYQTFAILGIAGSIICAIGISFCTGVRGRIASA